MHVAPDSPPRSSAGRSSRVARDAPRAAAGAVARSAVERELRGLYRLARLLAANRLPRSRRSPGRRRRRSRERSRHAAGRLRCSHDACGRGSSTTRTSSTRGSRSVRLGSGRSSIRVLEGRLARRADAVVTVSDGIAAELDADPRLPQRPLVVLNCPPLEPVDVESRDGRVRADLSGGGRSRSRSSTDLERVAAAGLDVTAATWSASTASSAGVRRRAARRARPSSSRRLSPSTSGSSSTAR